MGEENTNLSSKILICCEGKETEPQYFKIVLNQRRINRGLAKVKVVGNKGQHKALVDEAVIEREKLCKTDDLEPEAIETWAVCDKDEMNCSLAELEEYAAKFNINLAFSDPKFEIFLIQHFQRTSTNLAGRRLDAYLGKELQKKGGKSGYIKADLSILIAIFDQEPLLIEHAIKNCAVIQDKQNSPYTTVHILLARLLELAP